jgi:hypothetical protein
MKTIAKRSSMMNMMQIILEVMLMQDDGLLLLYS